MQANQTGLFYLTNRVEGAPRNFPDELRHRALSRLEMRFVFLVAACFVVIGGTVFVLSLRPVRETVTAQQILKIQERYASIVLNQPKPKVAPKPASEDASGAAAKRAAAEKARAEEEAKAAETAAKSASSETVEEHRDRREETRAQREQKRNMVRAQVRSSGLFAAITATGGAGSGAAGALSTAGMEDLLGATGGVGDVGNISVSKGTFATKGVTAASLGERREEGRTSSVGIERAHVGSAQGAQIASAGSVNITTAPAEIKTETGSGPVPSKTCIQSTINEQSRLIKRVYENWLKRDPGLKGQLKVRFVIQAGGTVSEASVVQSSTNNGSFDENILRYIKRWDFSSCGIAESIEIIFPFAFSGSE